MKWFFAAMGLLIACRVAVPTSLEGNWISRLTFHLCDDQSFCRYDDGRVTFYHEHDNPKADGTYTKVGWNTYRWDATHNRGKPITVHPGWLFLRYEGVGTNGTVWGFRDLRFRSAARIIRETEAMPPKQNVKAAREAE